MLWTIRLNRDLASFEAPVSSNTVQMQPPDPKKGPQVEPQEDNIAIQMEPPESIKSSRRHISSTNFCSWTTMRGRKKMRLCRAILCHLSIAPDYRNAENAPAESPPDE